MEEQKQHTRENRGTIHRMADPRLLFLFSRPPRRTFTRLGLGLGLGLARLLFLFSRPRRTFTRLGLGLGLGLGFARLLFLFSRPRRNLHQAGRLPCYLLHTKAAAVPVLPAAPA